MKTSAGWEQSLTVIPYDEFDQLFKGKNQCILLVHSAWV